MQCSAVQCSAVQCSAVQCRTVEHSTVFTVQYSTVHNTHYSAYIYSRAQDSTVQYLYSLVKGKRSVSERVVLRCSYRGQQEAHEEGGGKAEHGEAFTATGSVERLSELRYVYIYIHVGMLRTMVSYKLSSG